MRIGQALFSRSQRELSHGRRCGRVRGDIQRYIHRLDIQRDAAAAHLVERAASMLQSSRRRPTTVEPEQDPAAAPYLTTIVGFRPLSMLFQRDSALGAILLGGDGLRLQFAGDVLDEHDGVPYLVGVEDVGRQGVAAPVPLTPVCVDTDTAHVATGKINGSDSTDLSAAV
jgi:hypothetical protein